MILRGFLETGSEAAELFELAEGAFDQVALGIEASIERRFCRAHGNPSGIGDVGDHHIGGETLDEGLGLRCNIGCRGRSSRAGPAGR
jgi:hypothetical protein